MKQNKKLKLILMVLIIVLISIISFGGIYIENKGVMENVMPEYIMSRELKGYRRVELAVSTENKTSSNGETENVVEGTETTEQKINKDEDLNSDNYKKAKSIIEKRLNSFGVTDYIIRQNEQNGKIALELPENNEVDKVVGNLNQQGKFEIVDKDTQEVLMSNDDIDVVESGYGTTSAGKPTIIINIKFNKSGTEKFKEITNKYKEVDEIVTEDDGTQSTEKKEKEIELKLDDTALLTTHFDTQITNGIMQLTMAVADNATVQEIQEQLKEANSLAGLLNSGRLPLVYEINQNKYIFSNVNADIIKIVTVVMLIIAGLATVYYVIKYKVKGLFGGISLIGFIATLLVVIRFTNVEIAASGLVVLVFSELLNLFMINCMLKKENKMEAIKNFALMLIPALIISVVFTLSNLSMGAILFWTIIVTMVYNLVITKTMIK